MTSKVQIIFIDREKSETKVEATIGLSILDVAREYDIDLEGACEGSLACSTCHVIINPEIYEKLPKAEEAEEDMLDLAFDLTNTSRLGCQIIVNEDMEGATFRIP